MFRRTTRRVAFETLSDHLKVPTSVVEVLVDEPGVGRTHREAPEIDGVVMVPDELPVGSFATLTVTGALGPDLDAA